MSLARAAACLLAVTLVAPIASAADDRFVAQGVWSGVYQCGPMQSASGTFAGYTSSIRMEVEGNAARINKESAEIQETFSGTVAADGTLRLSGSGARRERGGAGWRYRFDGRFNGDRFDAQGAMFSAQLETRLRECSMNLTRSRSGERAAASPQTQGGASAQPEKGRPAATQAVQPAEGDAKRAAETVTGEDVEKALDFSRRNDSALVEGTVARGTPHRYRISARKGQQLNAALRSTDGARFDLYEPGSSLNMLSGGFIVQGARVPGNATATTLDLEIPADGTYLLLVRPTREKAFYALEMAVTRGTSAVDGSDEWWRSRSAQIAAAAAALVLLLTLVRFTRRRRRRHLFRAG